MRLNTVALGGCKAKTKKGLPCQSKDVYENGYCVLHGGQGKLPRLERLKEKTLKKMERFKRKAKKLDRMVARMLKDSPKLADMVALIRAKADGRL
jgi:hypothetical protein